jgi:DNA anti-recombination protein RmuC
MLKNGDLKAIEKIVDQSVERKLEPVKKDIGVLRQDVGGLKNDMKSVTKGIKHIKKNVDVMIDSFNRDDMRLQKRVKRVEEHLHLPPVQN